MTMNSNEHYKKTKAFFRLSAIEKSGYYNAKVGGKLKHNWWIHVTRGIIMKVIQDVIRKDVKIASLIDTGCGRADFTIDIVNRFAQLNDVWGVDFSQENLALAKDDIQHLRQVHLGLTDVSSLPFSSSRFDITICNAVLHHILPGDQEHTLKELARITKKYLILEIKNNQNLYYKYFYKESIAAGVRVYPTNVPAINSVLTEAGFGHYFERGVLFFNRLSPMVVVVYKRRTS